MLPTHIERDQPLHRAPAAFPGNLSEPEGVDHNLYFFCLLGPLALGLSIGLQLMLTGFLLFGPIGKPAVSAQLSGYGWYISHPEHDLHVWFIGLAITLLCMCALTMFWRSRINRLTIGDRPGFMKHSAILQAVLAGGSLLIYLLLVSSRYLNLRTNIREPRGPFDQWTVLLPTCMALLCLVLDMAYGFNSPANTSRLGETWHRRMNQFFLWFTPILIVVVIYVPAGFWPDIAGKSFIQDWCNHATSYMMGPAVSFTHGRAFGTEIYSQYGIGWPLTLATLSKFSALTYGNQFGLEIVCGCIYFLSLFLLLRVCFQTAVWAAIGTVLAIYWQLFTGTNPRVEEVMWFQPQTIMMRHWWDTGFFLMLLLHSRASRKLWIGLAGGFCAFEIFFQTETGIYLCGAFLFYLLLDNSFSPRTDSRAQCKNFGLQLLLFTAVGVATLLPLLNYASRGTLWSRQFWQGWLEPLITIGGLDLAALPIAEMQDDAIILFLVITAVYMGAIGYVLTKGFLHRKASNNEILLATVAVYGLAQLLIFISRSCYANLLHHAVPFPIILTALLFQCRQGLRVWIAHSALPYILAIGLTMLLLTTPMFSWYPSLLKSFFGNSPKGGLSLLTNPLDISGLPPEAAGSVHELQAVISTIQVLDLDGHDLVILDFNDAVLYYCAKIRPWSRYSTLFDSAYTKLRAQAMLTDFLQRTPKYAVIRGKNSPRKIDYESEWAALYALVSTRYVLDRTVGPYEFWRYSPSTEPRPQPRPLPFSIQ